MRKKDGHGELPIIDVDFEVVCGPREALPEPDPTPWEYVKFFGRYAVILATGVLFSIGLVDIFVNGALTGAIRRALFGPD
jgi:hypothetical protein